jgi:hypothetical protein
MQQCPLPYDVLRLVSNHSDIGTVRSICHATGWRIPDIVEDACLLHFRSAVDAKNRFKAACAIERAEVRKEVKDKLMLLLHFDVFMYARRTNSRGEKLNDALKLYRVHVTGYHEAPYRYSDGVDVVGEYNARSVSANRIFALPSNEEQRLRHG